MNQGRITSQQAGKGSNLWCQVSTLWFNVDCSFNQLKCWTWFAQATGTSCACVFHESSFTSRLSLQTCKHEWSMQVYSRTNINLLDYSAALCVSAGFMVPISRLLMWLFLCLWLFPEPSSGLSRFRIVLSWDVAMTPIWNLLSVASSLSVKKQRHILRLNEFYLSVPDVPLHKLFIQLLYV